ncbi:MAG: methylated-DNA--[protein]-cysteine S-methyltransferase [Candidatus Aminicenantes bacterium]|nr:methylated-DNA--[protein]-cysteine S-methyltransferase [Candidatus Aminicenantes bacterium]
MTFHYALVCFEKGALFLMKNDLGIQRITYVKNQDQTSSVLNQVKDPNTQLVEDKQEFMEELEIFRQYFLGKPVDFSSLELDFSSGTPFQKKIWQMTRKVTYGRTQTYKSLAQKINHKGYRSVGGALGKNPFLIAVPCHRIIRTDGTLGGFGAGIGLKKYFLNLEGAQIS